MEFNKLLSIYEKRKLKYIDFIFESDIHVIELQPYDRLAYLKY